MGQILPNIDHIVVLMQENRSFDNLVGWLYDSNNSGNINWVTNDKKHQYQGLAFGSHCNVAEAGGEPICVSNKGAHDTWCR